MTRSAWTKTLPSLPHVPRPRRLGDRIRRILAGAAWIAPLAALAGCSDQSSPRPSPPEESATLSGRVVLVSRLTDLSNQSLGEGRIEDADGVLVELIGPAGVVDSARTELGRYEFSDLAPGMYRVRGWVVRDDPQVTEEIPVAGTAVVASDTLTLRPSGALSTYPNPGAEDGVSIEVTVAGAQAYSVEVRGLDGSLVWHFSQEVFSPGLYHVHWVGHDSEEHEAPSGAYWILVHYDGRWVYNLVFWPGHETAGGPGNCGHINAGGLVISRHDEVLVTCWHGRSRGALEVGAGEVSHEHEILFLSPDSMAFAIADTCPDNHLSWTLADSNVASIRPADGKKWSIELIGKRRGSTEVTLLGWHEAHVHYVSPAIPLVVR